MQEIISSQKDTIGNRVLVRDIVEVGEETLLADVERRLIDEFPDVSPTAVNALIRQQHARFEASRIRDFVPLLVEKRARRELAHIE